MAIEGNGHQIQRAYGRAGGVWRETSVAKGVFAKDGSTWRKVFPVDSPIPPITAVTITPTSAQWPSPTSGTPLQFKATITGGSGDLSIVWSASAGLYVYSGQGTTTATFFSASSPRPAGTVTLVVTDNASGQQVTRTASIAAAPVVQPLTASVSPSSTTWGGSVGAYTRSFTVAASGGSGAYSYAWTANGGATITSGQGTASVTVSSVNGAAATVTCTVTDGSGTSTTASGSVAAVSYPALTASLTPSSTTWGGDPGAFTRAIAATIGGGSGQYTRSWSISAGTLASGQGTNNATFTSVNGAAATVTLTVTDTITNQSLTRTASIAAASIPALTLAFTPASPTTWQGSVGAFSRSVTATVTGGVPPYSYNWATTGDATLGGGQGTTTATATSVTGGNANLGVYVTDALGNQITNYVGIAAASYPAFAVSISPTATSWNASNRATATVTPSGGSGSYSYAWTVSNGGTIVSGQGTATATAQAASNGAAATLSCTVTDTVLGTQITRSCSVAVRFQVGTDPSTGTWFGSFPSYYTTLSATVSGGTAPYTYFWQSDIGGATITSGQNSRNVNLASGSGQPASGILTVTDALGNAANFQWTVLGEL